METIEAELLQEVLYPDPPTRLDRVEPIEPGLILRTLLGPARETGATSEAQLDVYRLLLTSLEGRLGDFRFALALHTEWIRLSPGAQARGARRWARQPGGEPRSDVNEATD
jgi:hypothetical protein